MALPYERKQTKKIFYIYLQYRDYTYPQNRIKKQQKITNTFKKNKLRAKCKLIE